MSDPQHLGVVNEVIRDTLRGQGRGAQTHLAKKIGMPQQTVNKWVKGYNLPEMRSWASIEWALDLPAGRLWRAAGIPTVAGQILGMLPTGETWRFPSGLDSSTVLAVLREQRPLTLADRPQLVDEIVAEVLEQLSQLGVIPPESMRSLAAKGKPARGKRTVRPTTKAGQDD